MADEINRASPRTQSALLQAMQEHHVSVGGERHDLPRPFHVLATQNPIEQEGTYPLPEAQLDRFLLEIDVAYPDRDAERRILIETTGADEHRPGRGHERRGAHERAAAGAPAAGRRQRRRGDPRPRALRPPAARATPRVTDKLALGPGPARQPGADAGGARPRADRGPASRPRIADVVALAEPVLKHRMALTFAARADGETIPERDPTPHGAARRLRARR